MTDDPALLRAVLANPADDTPRLVYADWLDENGQSERAEFIRVQCERPEWYGWRSGDVGLSWFDPIPAPHLRANEWVRRHGDGQQVLGAYVWDRLILPGVEGTYRRGFVAEIRLKTAAFMDHARAVFSRHPVEWVVLTDREPLEWSGTDPAVQRPGRFGWVRSRRKNGLASEERAEALPWGLFDLFPSSVVRPFASYSAVRYADRFYTREAALSALSAACVRYGRHLAGLPA